MTEPGWDDDALLAAIGDAVRSAGQPTPSMRAAAVAALSWRTIDEELLALTYDSLLDREALVRSSGASRTLVFEGGARSVEMELEDGVLVGQLVPASAGEIVLLRSGGEAGRTEADEMGCFRLEAPGRGPFRLRCRTSTETVVTDWLSL